MCPSCTVHRLSGSLLVYPQDGMGFEGWLGWKNQRDEDESPPL